MNNFHANFRSSGGFEDLLEHIMRNQQPATNPASRDVVDKLPIIKVEEKHCKKIEGKEEVEPPSWPVCIEEIGNFYLKLLNFCINLFSLTKNAFNSKHFR